jgi:tripartite-type tricarboxylate transporter receptor subunit TctC
VTTTAKVPAETIDKLHSTIAAIMTDPTVVEALDHEGTIPQQSPPPDELKGFVASEITRWGKMIEQAGLAGSE